MSLSAEIEMLLLNSPSLREQLALELSQIYPKAMRDANQETGLTIAGLNIACFPSSCPFRLDEILDSQFLPGTDN